MDTLEPVCGPELPMTSLLSHSHQYMQEETQLLNTVITQLIININKSKTNIKKTNTKKTTDHIERRATGRYRLALLHIPGQCNQQK